MAEPHRLADRLGRLDRPRRRRESEPEPPAPLPPPLESWLAAIESLAALLEEEAEALIAGHGDRLPEFIRRKHEAEGAVKDSARQAAAAGLAFGKASPHAARAAAAIAALERAGRRNAEALAAAHDAASYVAALVKKSLTETRAEGMYGRSGRAVAGHDRTVAGLDDSY
ncbi:hypothetical protein ACFW16_15680 [Inquilinus sp. NPDC058860]|uniref:hypothetical protein n=1 Tax=Inquilinus sp. NPDC058860 TaxID=3346652 RepID=UPI00369A1350